MKSSLSPERIEFENETYRRTGGVSAECKDQGFRPAFCDLQTGQVYPSRFGDGRPAPFHLLDGLPAELVLARLEGGRVTAVKSSVISGFELGGRFYSRDEAAALVHSIH